MQSTRACEILIVSRKLCFLQAKKLDYLGPPSSASIAPNIWSNIIDNYGTHKPYVLRLVNEVQRTRMNNQLANSGFEKLLGEDRNTSQRQLF